MLSTNLSKKLTSSEIYQQANQALLDENWKEAYYLFKEYEHLRPDNHYAKRCQAVALFKMNEVKKAVYIMGTLVNQKTVDDYYYYELAFMLHELEDYVQSKKCWEVAIEIAKKNPQDHDLLLYYKSYCRTIVASKDIEEMKKIFFELHSEFAEFDHSFMAKIIYYAYETHGYSYAATILFFCKEHFYKNWFWDLKHARLHYDDGEHMKAIEIYEQYVNENFFDKYHAHELAGSHETLLNFDKAARYYKLANDLAPDDMMIVYNRSLFEISEGNLEVGFSLYEKRWLFKEFTSKRRHFNFPQWLGEDLTNKHILVHAEQGIGDHIMFGAFLKKLCDDVHHKKTTISITVDRRLERVFRDIFFGKLQVLKGALNQEEEYLHKNAIKPDYFCSLGSLPSLYHFDRTNAPHIIGYPIAQKKEKYAAYFAQLKKQKKSSLVFPFAVDLCKKTVLHAQPF